MTKQNPQKQWSGCQFCKPHKNRRRGQAARTPWAALRQLGKRRRLSRHEVWGV